MHTTTTSTMHNTVNRNIGDTDAKLLRPVRQQAFLYNEDRYFGYVRFSIWQEGTCIDSLDTHATFESRIRNDVTIGSDLPGSFMKKEDAVQR